MATAAILSHPVQNFPHVHNESSPQSRSSIASCPSCGHHLLYLDNDQPLGLQQLDPVDAHRRIRDLEAQVKLLNSKAAAAVDKLADYEDEVRFLRAAYSRSQHLQPQQNDPTSASRNSSEHHDNLAPPTASVQQSRLASLSALTGRIRDSVSGINLISHPNNSTSVLDVGITDSPPPKNSTSAEDKRLSRPNPSAPSSLSYFNFGVPKPTRSTPNLISSDGSQVIEPTPPARAMTPAIATKHATTRSTSDLFASINPFAAHQPPPSPPPKSFSAPPPPTTNDNELPNSNETQSPNQSLTSLQTSLETERNRRIRAESNLNQTQTEIEELTAQLFGQANEMVATERKARARLEERVQILETRDREKRKRIERLEGAMERIDRVRGLVSQSNM